ncbi:hypothetical protein BaRGS_00015476 [Batillaria attramentaria]|uniref:G-protein coupled receptors family 1 profile domain-containing protein n=1 Tax=Batillaria attramentaria TaxID=370345 RepID=A0ABD0L217_9CAEN
MSGCKPVVERDFTAVPYPGNLPEPMPTWEKGLKIGACVCVEFVALFGNLLLIAVVLRTPRMRSTINCYIANMALADLMVALGPMWIHVTSDVIDGWPLGGFLCKFNSLVQVTAMVASVMTLMAIAGDRFFAIIFPLKSRVTERRVSFVVIFIWLSALGIGLPPLFFYTYTERQWKDYLESFCTDVWPAVVSDDGECDQGLTSKQAYWTVVSVVLNWLPMAVMVAVYAVIIHRLRFSRVQPSAGRNKSLMSAVQRRSKRKVVKMLVAVLISFMVCTIPFQVTNLYPLYSHDMNEKLPAWHKTVYFAAVFLMYTNSAINPILYGGLNENFRRGARDLFNSLLGRQTAPNLTYTTNLTMPRYPPVSVVHNEAERIAVKEGGDKNSLRQLAESAAYVYMNTALPSKPADQPPDEDDVESGENGDIESRH